MSSVLWQTTLLTLTRYLPPHHPLSHPAGTQFSFTPNAIAGTHTPANSQSIAVLQGAWSILAEFEAAGERQTSRDRFPAYIGIKGAHTAYYVWNVLLYDA